VLGGLLGAGWTCANTRLQRMRKTWLRRRWLQAADVVAVCFVTSTVRLLVSFYSPCSAVPSPAQLRMLEVEVRGAPEATATAAAPAAALAPRNRRWRSTASHNTGHKLALFRCPCGPVSAAVVPGRCVHGVRIARRALPAAFTPACLC
jgi:hypothetical protein